VNKDRVVEFDIVLLRPGQVDFESRFPRQDSARVSDCTCPNVQLAGQFYIPFAYDIFSKLKGKVVGKIIRTLVGEAPNQCLTACRLANTSLPNPNSPTATRTPAFPSVRSAMETRETPPEPDIDETNKT
jgi:hypothetical protein